VLQDPRCTPGAIDPRVTQANLDRTICRPAGYTDSVRPPTTYIDPLEAELIRSYGLSISPSQSELDHLISLELGGAPSDPRNLFPEPYAGSRGAYAKDTVENRLHDEVCSGTISLASAQHEILDWVKYYSGGSSPSGSRPSSTGSGGATPAHRGRSGGSNCTPGYSPCIRPGPDVDCAGGGGDGPRYVQGPVRVSGSDPYDLDGNDDGIGCS
jgi:hypothetical protein